MSGLLIMSLVVLPFFLFMSSSSEGCGISVYWGQNRNEGSLQDACSAPSPLYQYISLGFLETFGSGQNPVLNLGGHCSATADTCKTLASDITFCQKKGIKVLLSIGGPSGSYSLDTQQDASQVADYLYFTYLGGVGGPLGSVSLDGIDFDIQAPGSSDNWDHLAKAVAAYTKPNGDPYYLSATVGCSNPDPYMDAAIQTGVFNAVSVKFYDDTQCDSMSGVPGILAAWTRWSSSLPANTNIFMGLPASSSAVGTGYVGPLALQTQILPVIRNTRGYGGIMLWNRYYDAGKYSKTILSEVCRGVITQNRTLHASPFISQVV